MSATETVGLRGIKLSVDQVGASYRVWAPVRRGDPAPPTDTSQARLAHEAGDMLWADPPSLIDELSMDTRHPIGTA